MNSFKHKSNLLTFLTIFLTSFLLGIIFSFILADKIGSPMLINSSKGVISRITESKNDLELERFWEVYEKIKKNSYDIGNIDKEILIDGAIKGLVEGLGDKHSEYMNNEEKQQFEGLLRGDFEGIGAIVEEHQLGVAIDRVIKGSPALKYGIKSRDIVIKANGHELQNIDLFEAISYIKGPAGTKVDLEILREGENEILNITVVRDKITIPSVNGEILENNIGYIALNMFGDDTVEEFLKTLKTLENTDGLIIDLRDNGGGYLYAATEILSELLEHNTPLVTVKYSNRIFNEEYKSINFGETYNNPIVVLINENSASASEIVSGALHDHKKAILVGKKTYGKGSVQNPFEVSNNGLLKITIAKWFTPNDKNIDKEGIEPDIEIDFEKEDFKTQYDRQLETAKEVLGTYIQSNSIDITLSNYSHLIKTDEEKLIQD